MKKLHVDIVLEQDLDSHQPSAHREGGSNRKAEHGQRCMNRKAEQSKAGRPIHKSTCSGNRPVPSGFGEAGAARTNLVAARRTLSKKAQAHTNRSVEQVHEHVQARPCCSAHCRSVMS